jgi:hypothetical protein
MYCTAMFPGNGKSKGGTLTVLGHSSNLRERRARSTKATVFFNLQDADSQSLNNEVRKFRGRTVSGIHKRNFSLDNCLYDRVTHN